MTQPSWLRSPVRWRIFYGGVVPALGSEEEVELALQKSRNVLAELGGLYLALWQAPANTDHDRSRLRGGCLMDDGQVEGERTGR